MQSNKIEQELIGKAIKGDDRSFEKLIKKYDRRIMDLLLNILKNEDDASDAYQETFIKVHKNLHKFSGASSFYTWLYRIAVNTAYSFYGTKKEHMEYDEKLHSSAQVYEPADDGLSFDEKVDIVSTEIEKLSFQQKNVVYLKSYEGMKFREIADVLSLNEGTVKKYFHRAVENIRKNLNI